MCRHRTSVPGEDNPGLVSDFEIIDDATAILNNVENTIIMKMREDLIEYDFQGWPVFRMNLKEILLALGGTIEGDKLSFDVRNPIMATYPRILMDDGMGYGVDESAVVSVNANEEYINIFREPVPSKKRQTELLKQWDGIMHRGR